MKIILANPRGFCAGVNMAIESLERALEMFGTPLYVYHEIVHNRPVVERFRRRGVVFVDRVDEVPSGATLLYSAHGVAPAIREAAAERNLRAIDATCPLVTKVHLEAVRFAREGYTILLIGHEGHDEVLGTMGEAPEHIRLVQDVGEVERLELPAEARLAYLTQTTLSVDDADVIIAALKRRFPQIVGPSRDDICYATQNRQEAVKELVPERGRRDRAGQPEQLEQPAAGGTGQRQRQAGLPRGRRLRRYRRAVSPAAKRCSSRPGPAPRKRWWRSAFRRCVSATGRRSRRRTVREEHVSFPLPRELRLVSANGRD